MEIISRNVIISCSNLHQVHVSFRFGERGWLNVKWAKLNNFTGIIHCVCECESGHKNQITFHPARTYVNCRTIAILHHVRGEHLNFIHDIFVTNKHTHTILIDTLPINIYRNSVRIYLFFDIAVDLIPRNPFCSVLWPVPHVCSRANNIMRMWLRIKDHQPVTAKPTGQRV